MIPALAEREVLVCLGAGGVGKTSLSAALALDIALAGERVAVVTIDPARRLAGALGLEGLTDEPHRVALDDLAGDANGELWALQLDPAATFDRLVVRHAGSDEQRERILGNRIYRHLSRSVAGSQEFMAVERLFELVGDDRFERIVLDTPPAQNAVDFLDAPARIVRTMQGRALRMLGGSGDALGPAGRLFDLGGQAVIALVERVTGSGLLSEIREFVGAFEGMREGFAERAAEIERLLSSQRTGFVVIADPSPAALADARALIDRLEEREMPAAAAIMNRVARSAGPGPTPGELRDALAVAGATQPADLAGRVLDVWSARERAAGVGAARVGELRSRLSPTPVLTIPPLVPEPVELAGIAELARRLHQTPNGARG